MFFAWNVRGLNSHRRQALLRAWISSHRPSFGAFLETHLQPDHTRRIESSIPSGWRYHGNFEHHDTARIIVVWDPSISVFIYSATAQLVTCGIFIEAMNVNMTVSFVYAFNQPSQRVALWRELSRLNDSSALSSRPWVVTGDFNQILHCHQHSGHPNVTIDPVGMDDLREALHDADLFELMTQGSTFSWWNNRVADPVATKIDHSFVNQHWSLTFPDAYIELLPPLQSDHAVSYCHVPSLRRAKRKPFRFFHHVIDHPDYAATVESSWNPDDIVGSKQFKILRSLKLLKPALRQLNKMRFSGISERVKSEAAKLADLQNLLLTDPSLALADEEHRVRQHWLSLITAEEKFYRQRSRVTWLGSGDRNTNFFHRMVTQRNSNNRIHFFRDHSGSKITGLEDIKNYAARYFEENLGVTDLPMSSLSLADVEQLLTFRCSSSHRDDLVKVPSPEEIRSVLFAMPLNKCPGPDGYSAEFFRASWSTLGKDFLAAIREFFVNGRLLKDFNATALVLIPKTEGRDKISDYRPISCCNLIYKTISKILGNKLKPILQDCVSPNQAAFLKGRSLGDNVLLASDLIRNYQKSTCQKSCMIKIDLRKAFDTVCWDFVLKMLEGQGFPSLFISWIRECITTPRFSVSINGELAGFFSGRKGLRQGDPISPYLFIMVMESLSKMLEDALSRGTIIGHPLCANPKITHLLFADDLLVFIDGSKHSLRGIATVLRSFKEATGLDMNASKSEIFFGGYSDSEAAELTAYAGIRPGSFPTRYLGLPLSPTRLSYAAMQPFIERIKRKLTSWTSKLLSFAGKIRLISSVIYGMVNFWSGVFSLPKKFYRLIDSLCAGFLWKNSATNALGSRVAWKDVCKPKAEGGLGIRFLEDFEEVFRLKHIWNFFSNSGSLWIAWLKGNIFHRRGFWETNDSSRFSAPIRSMLQLKPSLVRFMRCNLGNGSSATFWFDSWSSLGQLLPFMGVTGPRQLRLPLKSVVLDAVREGNWYLPSARSSQAEHLQMLLTTTAPPSSSDGPDTFLWRMPSGLYSDTFSSKLTWEQLRTQLPEVPWFSLIWFKENVPRYAFVAWLALLFRLPTRDRLLAWGMTVPASCVLCSSALESHDHLFFRCPYSAEVWTSFSDAILPGSPRGITDITTWVASLSTSSRSAQLLSLFKLALQSVVYFLWRERNNRIFSSSSRNPSALTRVVDRSMRDRLLSIRAPPADTNDSLLLIYFGCISFY